MDCGLEHLLLVVALAEKLSCNTAGMGVFLQPAAVSLDQELFFWRDLNRQPLTEVHFFWAGSPHDADAMPKVQPRPQPCAIHE